MILYTDDSVDRGYSRYMVADQPDKYSKVVGSVWFVLGFLYLLYLTKGFTRRAPEWNIDDAI